MNGNTSEPAIEVFFPYAHEDEELRDKLATHRCCKSSVGNGYLA
jgi:hypothetical protein